MKATRYYRKDVLLRRDYLRDAWVEAIMQNPILQDVQSDGKVRYWGRVPEFGNRAFRVVTLEDGETVHNVFPDRDFEERDET